MPLVACQCGKKFRAIDALAGKQVNCPGCGRPLLIPQASLLDEELDRAAQSPVAAPPPRSRIQQRSLAAQGWLLAVLLAGGGIVVVAVLMALFSMFDMGTGRSADGELAANTPTNAAATDSSGGLATEPPKFVEEGHPEVELSSRAGGATSKQDTIPGGADSGAPTEADVLAKQKPRSPPPQNREKTTPAASARSGGSASQSQQNLIRLSTGVALAQTLPTGTAMGFSVDYEFNSSPPSSPVTLIWVVESGKGQTVRQPVQMTGKGTLEGFVTQFRPEHAPFSTHIEDQSGNRLSKSLPLR